MKEYMDRLFTDKKNRIRNSEDRELWLPFDDCTLGKLSRANKNVLHFYSGQTDEAVKKIIEFKPERLVLAYNDLTDVTIWNYMTFFTAWQQLKEKISCELFIYVPDRASVGENTLDKLEKKNFKRFTFTATAPLKLPDWKKYLDYEPHTAMPMWNFDANEFDFFAFYEFLCKRLAYIEKRMRLFPQLESGMSYANLRHWLFHKELKYIHRGTFSQESMLGNDVLRLWKLLDESSIENVMQEIKSCKMSNDKILWRLVELNSDLEDRIPKNALAGEIFREDTFKPYSFLFPMPLFLGYYAQMGNVGSYIPEYNFHEIIDALCKILQNEPCPELLPDIPDEPEISLEAYRNGYIKLAPRCKKGEVAASVCPEYKINMMLWDGGTLREMTVQEILFDAAGRIMHYFDHSKDALKYLHDLSRKFKDRYKRVSVVR